MRSCLIVKDSALRLLATEKQQCFGIYNIYILSERKRTDKLFRSLISAIEIDFNNHIIHTLYVLFSSSFSIKVKKISTYTSIPTDHNDLSLAVSPVTCNLTNFTVLGLIYWGFTEKLYLNFSLTNFKVFAT